MSDEQPRFQRGSASDGKPVFPGEQHKPAPSEEARLTAIPVVFAALSAVGILALLVQMYIGVYMAGPQVLARDTPTVPKPTVTATPTAIATQTPIATATHQPLAPPRATSTPTIPVPTPSPTSEITPTPTTSPLPTP